MPILREVRAATNAWSLAYRERSAEGTRWLQRVTPNEMRSVEQVGVLDPVTRTASKDATHLIFRDLTLKVLLEEDVDAFAVWFGRVQCARSFAECWRTFGYKAKTARLGACNVVLPERESYKNCDDDESSGPD